MPDAGRLTAAITGTTHPAFSNVRFELEMRSAGLASAAPSSDVHGTLSCSFIVAPHRVAHTDCTNKRKHMACVV
jgi:hypothetical protein